MKSVLQGLCLVLSTPWLVVNAFGSVTLDTTAAILGDESGNVLPSTGLVLLIASTVDRTFAEPTVDAFVSGDDLIVARWDLSAWGTPGWLVESTGPIALRGGWDAGDPLQLYWFPTLSLSHTKPGAAGVPYGRFRTDSRSDGGDPWTTPGDGATISLKFLTINAGGSNPMNTAWASLFVGGVAAPVILSLERASANSLIITWRASIGLIYRVWYRSELGGGWSILGPDIIATGATASAEDQIGGRAQRFYRIQLLQ
ncbi:MAG: hypothetical protein K9N62_00960 [Verrucomicrobia bacterium]|nr:hypothetical protein [Verrucomicrobiota bacterium]